MKFKRFSILNPICFLVYFLLIFSFSSCSSSERVKISDGLYSLETTAEDYSFAMNVFRGNYVKGRDDIFSEKPKADIGYTSSVYKLSYLGRTYNTLMNDDLSYVIISPKSSNSFASVSVAKGFSGMNEEFSKKSSKYDTYYKVLGYSVVDGINENGVAVSMSAFPIFEESVSSNVNTNTSRRSFANRNTTNTKPSVDLSSLSFDERLDSKNDYVLNSKSLKDKDAKKIYSFMVCRYILNTAESAKDAVDKLSMVQILDYPTVDGKKRSLHFLIADSKECYSVEFKDGEIFANVDTEAMTDFSFAVSSDSPMFGRERYDELLSSTYSIKNERNMTNLMKKLYYSGLYLKNEDEFNYNDCFVDRGIFECKLPKTEEGKLDIEKCKADYYSRVRSNSIYVKSIQLKYENRPLNKNIFSSSHVSVYDTANKTLRVIVRENNNEYSFKV